MISATALNSFVWTILVTKFINPENISSNLEDIFPEEIGRNFENFVWVFCASNFLVGLVGVGLISPMEKNWEKIKSLKNLES